MPRRYTISFAVAVLLGLIVAQTNAIPNPAIYEQAVQSIVRIDAPIPAQFTLDAQQAAPQQRQIPGFTSNTIEGFQPEAYLDSVLGVQQAPVAGAAPTTQQLVRQNLLRELQLKKSEMMLDYVEEMSELHTDLGLLAGKLQTCNW